MVLILGMISCKNIKTIDELRQIEVGQTQIEVLYLLGEPFEVELEVGYEEWEYRVESKGRYYNSFIITIVNEEVTSFRSY